MKTNRKEQEILTKAIDEWASEGKITPQQSADLKQSIGVSEPAQQLAHYFFFIALSCVLLAFGAIFIDDKLIERLKHYFALSNVVIALVFTILGGISFVMISRRKNGYSKAVFEVYSVISSLLVLTALIYICKDIGTGPKYTGFLAMASVVLFALSVWLGSEALWVEGILALMGWYGAFTAYQSSDDLFLGMNYPVRFAVFGVLITALSFAQSVIRRLELTQRITYITGLIILLTGLWGVSVFGNYNSLDEWAKVRQVQVIWYALLFAAVAAAIFFYGLKTGDNTTRDIGILSLIVNLYSRYFEYFWDNTNKGLFFLILAVSFWFLGKRIEKQKRLKRQVQANGHQYTH